MAAEVTDMRNGCSGCHQNGLSAGLGVAFLLLKGYEWKDDFDKHLFPGADFSAAGPDAGGAKLF